MRKMPITTIMLLAALAVLVPVPFAYAHDPGKGVTPYGDFCPRCSSYGVTRGRVGHREAVEAVRSYFGTRGLEVSHMGGRGRFIRFDVLKEGERVDTIIFDIRTGRIRSIY